MDQVFADIYFNPKNPAAYAGVNKLYKQAKRQMNSITLRDTKKWLLKQYVYTLHRQARRTFPRNRIIVSRIDQQWEMDLIDVQRYARNNDNYRYILVAIDCFSKYAWAEPVKSKRAGAILKAFKKIITNGRRRPHKLRTDKGGEFDNKKFKKYCLENDIIYFTTQNVGFKCAIIERFNRTLIERIERQRTDKHTNTFIQTLPDILDAYNNSFHRSIQFVPAQVTKQHESVIFKNLYGVNSIRELYSPQRRQGKVVAPKLKVGDNVRRKYDLKIMDKSYYPLWSDIIYKVDRVYAEKAHIPQYTISLDNVKLKRRFYPEELQLVIVDPNNLYRVEKVIKYKTLDGQQLALVKWIGYPPQYNSWIPTDHMKD